MDQASAWPAVLRDIEQVQVPAAALFSNETPHLNPAAHNEAIISSKSVKIVAETIGRKLREGSRHARKPHDFKFPPSPQQSEEPERGEVSDYFASRREMEGFNRCVFLLWGSGDKTWAVDVALTDQNEEKAFQALRKRYSEIRGILGMLFYFKTLIVKRVEFRFIHRTSNKFQVSLEQTTPEEPIHALEATSQDLAIAIDRQVSPSNFCYKANEEWIHELGCPAFNSITSSELYLDPETFCAVEAFYRLKDLIIWRQKIGWLSLFFTNPRAAREHRVLDGPGVKEKTVMHYEFLKVSQSLHDSRRYDTFPGLLVQESSAFEGWATGRMVCLLVGLAVPLVSVAKVALGSWEAAFTAGSFILAIPMVVFAVLKVS